MANILQSALQQAMGAMDKYVTNPIVNGGVQALRGVQGIGNKIKSAQDQAYQSYWAQRPHEMISPLASPTPNPTDVRMQQQGYTKMPDGSYTKRDPKTGFVSTMRFGPVNKEPAMKNPVRIGPPGINGNVKNSNIIDAPIGQQDVANMVKAVSQKFGRNPSINKISVAPEVSSAIEMAAQHYKVPAALLYDIAMQESTLNPGARNPEPGVTAAGLFQINNPTWDTISRYGSMPGNTLKQISQDRMDPRNQALAAAYLIKNGQLGRWDASKNVWGKFWPQQELDAGGYYSQMAR